MCALRTENRESPPNPGQQPSSSRRKWSSQPSFEFSSSEECLVAEKGREKEENGRKESSGETAAHCLSIAEVIDSYRALLRLLYAQSQGKLQKYQNQKLL